MPPGVAPPDGHSGQQRRAAESPGPAAWVLRCPQALPTVAQLWAGAPPHGTCASHCSTCKEQAWFLLIN